LHETSQPIFIEGYHKPSAKDKDDAVYDALQDLMSNGRTSRLYRSLVRDKKIAAQTGGFNGFPGSKYPNMFVFFSISTPGHTPQENRDAIHAEIERLRNEDISDEELQMVKTRAKADLLRRLGDNQGLAFQLGTTQSLYSDWRQLFRHIDEIEKVSKTDIRRLERRRSNELPTPIHPRLHRTFSSSLRTCIVGPGLGLEPDSAASLAHLPSATSQAHSTGQRNGHLSSGGSRAAPHPRHSANPRRVAG
jgi:predicted Zn-dependent peptidase